MIPTYLSKIGHVIKKTNDKTLIHLRCECGCEEFYCFKKKKDSAFLRLEEEYSSQIINEYGKGFEMMSDKDGNVFMVKRNIFGKIIKKEPFNKKSIPIFMNYVSALCKNCGNEYVLFDQALHGYDAVGNKTSETPVQKKYSNKSSPIEMEFFYNKENEEMMLEDNSLAFGRIIIFTEHEGKKRKLIDVECE